MLKDRKLPGNIWGGLIILIRMLGGLGMQKYMAVFFGPAGTTLLSHFQNFISLFSQPVQDAVAQGLISAYPNSQFPKRKLAITAILLTALIFIFTICLLDLFGALTSEIFNFSVKFWAIVLFSIFLIAMQGVLSAWLIAQQKLKFLALFNSIQWLTIFSVLLIPNLEAKETLLLFTLLQGLSTLVLGIILLKNSKSNLPFSLSLDPAIITHFKQFILMALTVWISSKWVDFFIREYAIQLFGTIETGLWQSVVRLSEAYRGLLISFLLLTFYPVVSQLYQSDQKQLALFLKKSIKAIAGFSCVFFLCLFIVKKWVIILLYSSEYVEAIPLLNWQILGDFLAFISFPFALIMMATVSTGKYIASEIVSALIFVACILLGNFAGIEILVYAHVIRFVFYLNLVIFFTKKHWTLA